MPFANTDDLFVGDSTNDTVWRLVDLDLVWINPTFLAPQLVGGFLPGPAGTPRDDTVPNRSGRRLARAIV